MRRKRASKFSTTSSSAGRNGDFSGGGVAPSRFSISFSMSISILVARKLATAEFVDELSDDRLALGYPPALATRRDYDRLVERGAEQGRQIIPARTARVAGLPLLEPRVQRGSAAADLVFALDLIHAITAIAACNAYPVVYIT